MSTDPVHSSTIGTNSSPNQPTSDGRPDDPNLPPQRHAGAVGIGPNYPLGASLGDKLEGFAEEMTGKMLRKPDIVEHGRERRTGELVRKERERANAIDPPNGSRAQEGG